MEVIMKTLDDWVKLLTKIDELRKDYGYSIFSDAKRVAYECSKGNACVSKGILLVNLLYNSGIRDFLVIANFIDSIKCFSNFEGIVNQIPKLAELYGVNKLAFINKFESENIKIGTYVKGSNYRKVYTPRYAQDIVTFLDVNLKTNRDDVIKINNFDPFIVVEGDLESSQDSEKIYFTGNFNFRCATLPLKEEMNIASLEDEREFIFENLVSYLQYLQIPVKLEIRNPNQEYMNENSFTIRSDGNLFNSNGDLLLTSDILENGKAVLVKNASFVLLADIKDGDISSVYLIVDQEFYNNIKNSNIREMLKALVALEDKGRR